MPDVTSTAPTTVRTRCALEIHKRSIVAAFEPEDPRDGGLELIEIENSERALRRLVRRLGGPAGLVVCYEAGPCGYAPYRLLGEIGVACDVIAPSLTRASRAGGSRPIAATPRSCSWRTAPARLASAARHPRAGGPARPGPLPLRHRRRPPPRPPPGVEDAASLRLIFEGKRSWTKLHGAWIARQRLADLHAQRALEHHLLHLDALDAQLAALESELAEVARSEPWSDPVR